MKQGMKRLPDLELEAMLVIWKSDRVLHTGEIHKQITEDRPMQRQATQMVLSRLEDKGFVRREKIGNNNYFHPLVAERDYRDKETATFLEKMYGNSPAKLMAALVENDTISAEDAAEIKRILERG
jgi:predicted transcriptional regulator